MRYAVQHKTYRDIFCFCDIHGCFGCPQVSRTWLYRDEDEISVSDSRARLGFSVRRAVDEDKVVIAAQACDFAAYAPAGNGGESKAGIAFAKAFFTHFMPCAKAALGVNIHYGDALSALLPCDCKMYSEGSFAGAALLLGYGNYFRFHIYSASGFYYSVFHFAVYSGLLRSRRAHVLLCTLRAPCLA